MTTEQQGQGLVPLITVYEIEQFIPAYRGWFAVFRGVPPTEDPIVGWAVCMSSTFAGDHPANQKLVHAMRVVVPMISSQIGLTLCAEMSTYMGCRGPGQSQSGITGYYPPPPPSSSPAHVNKFAALCDAVLAAVREAGSLPSRRAICSRVTGDKTAKLEAIRTLLADGRLVESAQGFSAGNVAEATPDDAKTMAPERFWGN